MAVTNLVSVWLASTVPSSTAPLLSCTSSPAIRSVDAGDGVRDLDGEVAEVVVHDADDRPGVVVADVQARHWDDRVVGDHALRVGVVRAQQEAAAHRAEAGVGPVVADDR